MIALSILAYILIGLMVGLKMFSIGLHNLAKDGRTFENAKEDIKGDFLATVLSALFLWPVFLSLMVIINLWERFSKLLLRFCEKKFEKQKTEVDKNVFVKHDLFDEP